MFYIQLQDMLFNQYSSLITLLVPTKRVLENNNTACERLDGENDTAVCFNKPMTVNCLGCIRLNNPAEQVGFT